MAISFRKKKYENPIRNAGSPEFEVNNWIISSFVLERLTPIVGTHPFPLDELSLMTAAICRFRPRLVFEWGTNVGKSARIFHEAVLAFEISCHIHSIDLPDDVFHNEHPEEQRGRMVRGKQGVTLHQGDGITCATEILQKESLDGNVLFFVDGDHSYESVHRELSAILNLIPHPVVLLHDTFYQSEESGYNTGPHRAIREVLATHPARFNSISTQLGLPGMTLIYERKD